MCYIQSLPIPFPVLQPISIYSQLVSSSMFCMRKCGGLNKNIPDSVIPLNTWCLGGGTAWKGLGGVSLWECALRFQKSKLFPVRSLCLLVNQMQVLSYCSWVPCLGSWSPPWRVMDSLSETVSKPPISSFFYMWPWSGCLFIASTKVAKTERVDLGNLK